MKKKRKITNFLDKLLFFFATTFFSGLIPGAPGTYASFITCLFVVFIIKTSSIIYLGICILIFIFGLIAYKRLLPYYDDPDPPELNIDEIAGQLITFIFVPFSLLALILGFIFFRFFDIVKPFPIGYIDKKIKNIWGVMLDDVLAGIFSNILLHFLIYVFIKLNVNLL
jgi:phosphatidylglycerophosphatase A